MSHICIDARMIHNSGIGVYIRKYVEYLLEKNVFKVTLIGRRNDLIGCFGEQKNWELIEANFSIYSITEQLKLPILIPECDVFWSPHYNIPIGPIKASRRIVTIPDVFHLAYLNTLSIAQRVYAKLVTNAAAYRSDKILTISNFSKKEIVRLTGTNPDKIKTIYLGLDNKLFHPIEGEKIREEVRNRYQLPLRYILFVGNVKPNKNLRLLVEAFEKVVNDIPDLHLLIVGKKDGFINEDHTLFIKIEQNPVLKKRVLFSGYVSLDDLPVLYNMACVFAFPSIYEGFGFPPLEAMACKCPVVASDRASIPEICGDAALYVDPTNSDNIADGIKEVILDSICRKKLINAGLQKILEYNWVNSQQEFLHELNLLSEKH